MRNEFLKQSKYPLAIRARYPLGGEDLRGDEGVEDADGDQVYLSLSLASSASGACCLSLAPSLPSIARCLFTCPLLRERCTNHSTFLVLNVRGKDLRGDEGVEDADGQLHAQLALHAASVPYSLPFRSLALSCAANRARSLSFSRSLSLTRALSHTLGFAR
jgi:hypothetical protein